MNAAQLIRSMERYECQSTTAPDARATIRDERLALAAAVHPDRAYESAADRAAHIGQVLAEARRVCAMWGVIHA